MLRAALWALLASLAFTAPALAGGVPPDHLYGVTATDPPRLVAFESVAPVTFTSDRDITGLLPGDATMGIDTSQRDGGLYVFPRNAPAGRIYSLDATTAVATLVDTMAADPSD